MKKLTFLFALLISLAYSANAQVTAADAVDVAKDPDAYMASQRAKADDLKAKADAQVTDMKAKVDAEAAKLVEKAVAKAGKNKMAQKMARKTATKQADKLKAKVYEKTDKITAETDKKYAAIMKTAEDKIKSTTGVDASAPADKK